MTGGKHLYLQQRLDRKEFVKVAEEYKTNGLMIVSRGLGRRRDDGKLLWERM